MPPSSTKQLGDDGEGLVAQWLQQQGWQILAQQWHCRWGELDLIARHPDPAVGVAFVEVKTRHRSGIDQGGRLAITLQKQQKLWHSAQLFLAEHPEYCDLPCRFDVALVQKSRPRHPTDSPHLKLDAYIENAFQGVG
ncbi:MAG: YraN family protein [Leptolyngbyaceae cyanobacterium]